MPPPWAVASAPLASVLHVSREQNICRRQRINSKLNQENLKVYNSSMPKGKLTYLRPRKFYFSHVLVCLNDTCFTSSFGGRMFKRKQQCTKNIMKALGKFEVTGLPRQHAYILLNEHQVVCWYQQVVSSSIATERMLP